MPDAPSVGVDVPDFCFCCYTMPNYSSDSRTGQPVYYAHMLFALRCNDYGVDDQGRAVVDYDAVGTNLAGVDSGLLYLFY